MIVACSLQVCVCLFKSGRQSEACSLQVCVCLFKSGRQSEIGEQPIFSAYLICFLFFFAVHSDRNSSGSDYAAVCWKFTTGPQIFSLTSASVFSLSETQQNLHLCQLFFRVDGVVMCQIVMWDKSVKQDVQFQSVTPGCKIRHKVIKVL